MSIYFLGPEGSYTQIAAEALNINEQLKPLSSIKKIISEIDRHPDIKGVVPLENSVEGIVRESIDNIIRTKDTSIQIMKEIILPISHCFVTKAKRLNEIKTIYSHPQALGQCQNFINSNLNDNIKVIATASTSEAVRTIKDKDASFAAIANEKAASIYSIKILQKNINDEPDNKTRFVLLGREQLKEDCAYKTAFAFSTPNRAGALVDVMEVFKRHNINLSYIDSRPSKKVFGEYTFFIESDAHCEDKNLRLALEAIQPLTTFIRFVGSYPKGKY